MSIIFTSSLTQKFYTWTNWKIIQLLKGDHHQYDDDGVVYTIYFYDGPEIYICTIWKNSVPDGIISGGYSQSQNDADKSDFETNYISNANRIILNKDSLYSFDGNPTIVNDGYSFSSYPSGMMMAGSDGYNSHFLAMTAGAIAPIATTPSLVVAQSPNLPQTATLSNMIVDANSNGDNILIAGISSQTIRVFKVALVFSIGGAAIFKDGATQLSGPLVMFAGGSIVLDMDITNPWFLTSTGNDFIINLASGATVGGIIYYTQS